LSILKKSSKLWACDFFWAPFFVGQKNRAFRSKSSQTASRFAVGFPPLSLARKPAPGAAPGLVAAKPRFTRARAPKTRKKRAFFKNFCFFYPFIQAGRSILLL
jgi:hypothetical protein